MKIFLASAPIFLLCGFFAVLQAQEPSFDLDSGDSQSIQKKSASRKEPKKKGKKKSEVSSPSIHYTIVSKQTEMVLSIHHGLKREGETLLIWSNAMTDSQKWELRPMEKPFIKLVAKHSGMPVGIKNGSEEEGAKVVQLSATDTSEQLWRLTMDPDGYARFQNRLTKKYLTIEYRGQGAHLIQKKKLHSDDQKFRLVIAEFK